MDLSFTKEQADISKSIIEFASKELNNNIIEDEEKAAFSHERWNKCAEIDLMGLLCPIEYGGCGMDLVTSLVGIQGLSYACKDSGLVHAIVTQLCCIIQISLFGNEDQKELYLSELSRGKKIAAQAITEPDAGSDVLSMRTEAIKDGTDYILNGSKTFISNGPLADVILVFAVTNTQRKRFGGISCFIVEKGLKGFSQGEPLDKMGLRTLQNGELFFDECRVPVDKVVGKEGQGIIIFNQVIEWERALMSAAHLGTMERLLELCIRYAKGRQQFGQPIGSFQSISNKLADIKMTIELGKAILYKAAWLKDRGRRATLETSIAKLFISEGLKSSCLEAVQIHGGYGYMKESELERELRDSVAATIYSGTSELQRNIISSLAGL
jgi:alkylation response protein AidB-like acyl-CoA dehydrogenase